MKLPPRLAALVVKDGVSLGLLAEADRALSARPRPALEDAVLTQRAERASRRQAYAMR